jgi:hypothetical protein
MNRIPVLILWYHPASDGQPTWFRVCPPEEGYYYTALYYFVVNVTMKTVKDANTVDDSSENLEICMKYCGSCPTFKRNNLGGSPPGALFCARGRTSNPSNVKTTGCYCPACEVFTRNKLVIGYFCTKG